MNASRSCILNWACGCFKQLRYGSGASGAEEVFPAKSGRHQGEDEGETEQASRKRFSCQSWTVKIEEQKHRCHFMHGKLFTTLIMLKFIYNAFVISDLSLHSCSEAVCTKECSGEQQSSRIGSADRERKGTASTGGHSAAEERKAGALLSPADAEENTERSGSR